MDQYLLPATIYESPSRQVRKHILNTIIEDEQSEDEEAQYGRHDSPDRGRARMSGPPSSFESSSPVPSLTSSVSSYYKTRGESQDYDDLYDISDDDSQQDPDVTPGMFPCIGIARSASPSSSTDSRAELRKVPSLIIPSPSHWPTIQRLKDGSPPLPLKVPLSPAVLSLIPRDHAIPSYPPSLDSGSVSDPLACSTNPSTPDVQVHPEGQDIWGSKKKITHNASKVLDLEQSRSMEASPSDEAAARWYTDDSLGVVENTSTRDFGAEDIADSPILGSDAGCSEPGVQLPPQALDTLQHLSLDIPSRGDKLVGEEQTPPHEMQEVAIRPSRPSSADFTPMSHASDSSLSILSIPSPGGFFSSLGANARHTWCLGGGAAAALAVIPPSSTTAENFYNCPWNQDPSATIEQLVAYDDDDTEGPPTARQLPAQEIAQGQGGIPLNKSPELPRSEDIGKDYDEDYEKAIQQGPNIALIGQASGSLLKHRTWQHCERPTL